MTTEEYRADIDTTWILRAMRDIKYGEVMLIIHNGQLVRVDTKERKEVSQG
jgi:hypothetical protein